MRRYLPILLSLLMVLMATIFLVNIKQKEKNKTINLGSFEQKQSCVGRTKFLDKLVQGQPVAIDLTQQSQRGVAFLFGRDLRGVVHKKSWERFDHLGTYTSTPTGDMYLAPMPFISISEKTFGFQKSIYRLDSNSGELERWMSIDEVKASSNNPFGLIAIDYDCDDDTLWVSAIDESDYDKQRGVIYHIDVKSKKILQRVEGVDALSLKVMRTQKGKYLFVGSAKENKLLAFEINSTKLSSTPFTILELPSASEFIRKIVVRGKNHLELQMIPFSYTLIAQTEEWGVRYNYNAKWNPNSTTWKLTQKN